MKWETIKTQVADTVCDALTRGGLSGGVKPESGEVLAAALFDSMAERRPWRESVDDMARLVRERIEAWDVRCVGKLRELFPYAFPASLRTGPLVADCDHDDGEWRVTRAA